MGTPDKPPSASELRRRALPNLVGMTLGERYRVLGLLGRGGMSSVYRVEHLGMGREFALKLLDPSLAELPQHAARFEREVQAHARVRSEHTVNIVDCDTRCELGPYLVMELLLGETLAQLLARNGPLPPARVANIGIDACFGLAAVHDAGLVHRDLKPDNLFVTTGDDGRELVKLLDFGVVKLLGNDATEPGALVGTLRYMAPEQLRGEHGVGPHTDLYALGVTLYECLAGAPPFEAETAERYMFKILNEAPTPLDARAAHAPEGLISAIHRALEREPAKRFTTAMALLEALQPFSMRRTELRRGRPWQMASVGAEAAPAVQVTTAVEAPPVSSAPPRIRTESGGPRKGRVTLALLLFMTLTLAFVTWRMQSERELPPTNAAYPSQAASAPVATAPKLPSSSRADPGVEEPAREQPAAEPAKPRAPSRKARIPASPVSAPPTRNLIDPEIDPLIEQRR